ncbi:6-carboxytetrahydropterin synthase QueD [Desulfurispira natronophila]|uniref:6-carboxy-5,6,7,8-tetrahydropterin synthase n=1 Tax=Desulfurispira natronophila TaxID=682562 RepID=A0A7W7Y2K0_9BACT|nr:6-carboxytetrahydropterin synthase QueD [Desulfurispira natronophila]MBB5020869.1 6-pyruvoyltetrahydropterin/6-carboxytetrahydropterin synthase [Desulfurispira natronophila]
MFELKVTEEFASAHNLRNYQGKCENIHGHNYVVNLYVQGKELQHNEMLVDFKILKNILRTIMDYLDHKYLNDIAPFDKWNPTGENIARYIYGEASRMLLEKGINNAWVGKVEVYETSTSSATYWE